MDNEMQYERKHLEEIKKIAYEEIDILKKEAEVSEIEIISAKKDLGNEASH